MKTKVEALRKEREARELDFAAEQLGKYLDLAQELTEDYPTTITAGMHPERIVVQSGEKLKRIEAMIYVCRERLTPHEYEIHYDESGFSVRVIHDDSKEIEVAKEASIDTGHTEDQKKEYQRHIERAKELEYYAGLVFEVCQDKETVKSLAYDPNLVMAQTDEEFKKLACALYTAAQSVLRSHFGAEFVFKDYEVKVKAGEFFEVPF